MLKGERERKRENELRLMVFDCQMPKNIPNIPHFFPITDGR
jgi:hypothetical protein